MLKELINKIKQNNLDLNLGEIEGLLYLILNNQGISNNTLVQSTGLPKETLKRFKDSKAFRLEELLNDTIEFSSEMREQLFNQKLSSYKWILLYFSNPYVEKKISD